MNNKKSVPYKLLLVDDDMEHVRLMKDELLKVDLAFKTKVIYLEKDFIPTLKEYNPHIIIADHNLAFGRLNAYNLMQQSGKCIPFITLANELTEEQVTETYQKGIDDYLLRSDIKRLPFSITNVLKRRRAEEEYAKQEERLQAALNDLKFVSENYEAAREEEKLSISRELHDELGQILTALKIDIKLLRKKVLSKDTLKDKMVNTEFDHILATIDRSTHNVRKIAAGLRPDILDKLGLVDAIDWLAEETNRRYDLKCKAVLPDALPFNNEYYKVTIFRIVQEALTNVVRHAEASEVLIKLTVKHQNLYLTINDNGRGITKEKMSKSTSLGLIGLRERVFSLQGRLDITGNENDGTEVSVIIPVEAQIKQEEV